jgi:hypothetical protein
MHNDLARPLGSTGQLELEITPLAPCLPAISSIRSIDR